MSRYQLRLRGSESLGDVLDRLTAAIWRDILSHPEFALLGHERKESLRKKLKGIFERFIVRYDVCGLQALCEETIEPAGWNTNPASDLAARHPWQSGEVKRLVVDVEKGLEEFVDALVAAIFREVITTPEQAHLAKALRSDLSEAIKSVLGPHLYRNVACGLFELCKVAEKVDQWK